MEKHQQFQALYNFMNENLVLYGKSMPCTEIAFTLYCLNAPFCVDYTMIQDLDNRSFLDASYLLYFNRAPERSAKESWERRIENLPEEKFRKNVTSSLVKAREFSAKETELHYCWISTEDRKSKENERNQVKSEENERIQIKVYNFFHPLYMKLPLSIRNILKRHLRAYFLDIYR